MPRLLARCALLAGLCISSVQAAEPFVVQDIRVDGLQRISAGTVFSYMPIKVGDSVDDRQVADAIRALFKTGFFKDVRLQREGGELVVQVEERPAITSIKIEGNQDIKSEDLTKALKNIGLAEGRVFNRQILDKVEQELRRQYYSRGKYALKIDSDVTPLSRNRVAVTINISEGRAAKIRQINIVGNKVFKDKDLVGQFELSTPNLLSFYTKDDQYSKQKLSADMERLRSYYMDRGYIKFEIDSTQVSITPDKKDIYVTINVKEGEVYTLEEVKLEGNLVVNPDELLPLMEVGPGEVFSRKAATETSKAISDRLGDDGYIFANVNMVPEIDDAKKTVKISFYVDPGKQVYARRINFKGNNRTRDEVLRREMRQMEAGLASSQKIERSKTRLERLGYFQDVNVETPAVPGTADQIDINYSVTEKPSGNLMAGIGFSQTQGFIFNASITQDNIFGSGKRVSASFNNSSISRIYQFGYLNPYFTMDGVSLGYDMMYRETNAYQANVSRYSTNSASASANIGIPLNEYDRFRFNAEIESVQVNTSDYTSTEIFDYLNANGRKYVLFPMSVGWSHDTLNRALLPTSGGGHQLSALATVPGSDLKYYKLSYKVQYYFPLSKAFTLGLQGEADYGGGYGKTGELPFFEHFYAGGVLNSVRGYQDNSLGPRDSTDLPYGGSSKVVGTAELYFPIPFVEDSKNLRLGLFMDAGNVFKDMPVLGDLRYSAGLTGKWLSPFGAIKVSIGQPLNAASGDKTQAFQFQFGAGF
ncbi:MAG: outer membrane protein assembly factor BamA [Methylococcaceae bacterium]|nr:MAG: outer membrane protein assembly factor BamA [Methylococcaceae bacterium]